MMKYLGWLLPAVLLIPWLASRANACSCVRGVTVCQAYAEASAVFIGIVSEISPTQRSRPDKSDVYFGKLARISVVEIFKGVSSPEITVVTGNGGGDCGYPFERGKRYLVYGYTA